MTRTAPLPMPAFWCRFHHVPYFAYQDAKRHWHCAVEVIESQKDRDQRNG